ncbi:MAG: M23 family metallopeptidase [Phormidesmis sp. RL_2_1]|nr:M23 family metallopeptidase [Phormidesmis sp. RL_2_1]
MPAYKEGGSIPAVDDKTLQMLGYDPGRIWQVGDLPSKVVRVGDIESGLGAEELMLYQIAEMSGLSLDELLIGDLPFLQGITLGQFLKDVPFLEDWPVNEIPLLGEISSVFTGENTLGQIIEANSDLIQSGVSEIFGEIPISAIPNLSLAALGDFEGIGGQVIANVPGLGDIKLGAFPIPVSIPSMNVFPMQDIAFGEREYFGDKPTPDPVSGGTNGSKDWEPIACSGGCPHIELHESGWEGANWMTKAHRVRDGYGFLGGLIGEAGAHRLPFGNSFALQLTNTDEKTGTAEWGLAFRVCFSALFVDLGCTAYFMEVPLGIRTAEEDNVLTGVRDGRGGATQPMKAPPGYEDLRPDTPPDLQAAINAQLPPSSSSGYTSLCGDGPGGVKLEALAEAFGMIESRGSGDYGAVGIFVNLSAGETGRALGKYQYMSYRSDVIAKIGSTPAGAALIRKARSGAKPTAEEVLAGFPPDDQDDVFMADQINNIERAMARGHEGGRLIEVLGQMHLRGAGVLTNGQLDSGSVKDGLGTTLKRYGERFLEYYNIAAAKTPDSADRCSSTGQYINPTEKGYKDFSRKFSSSRVPNPVTGRNQRHDGDDIRVPQGETVVASDGGVVEWRSQCSVGSTCGYGWYMLVHHDDGNATLYAHLSKRLAADGSRVKQGQVIALSGGATGVPGSGGSTGPHLHFEFRLKGQPVPPETMVDYNKTVADIAKEVSL